MWVNVIVHFLFEYMIRILFRIKRKIQKKQKFIVVQIYKQQ